MPARPRRSRSPGGEGRDLGQERHAAQVVAERARMNQLPLWLNPRRWADGVDAPPPAGPGIRNATPSSAGRTKVAIHRGRSARCKSRWGGKGPGIALGGGRGTDAGPLSPPAPSSRSSAASCWSAKSRRISPDGERSPLRSRSNPGLTCVGEFSATEALGDAGQLRCSDGASATFEFQRLSLRRGYGAGKSSRGALSFTYGLTAEESAAYLKLPAGRRSAGQRNPCSSSPQPRYPLR